MAQDKKHPKAHLHSSGCGCAPAFFVDMMENAGLQLFRREFVKGVAAAGGMPAAGGLSSAAFAGSLTSGLAFLGAVL